MKINYKNLFEEFEKPVPIGSENENYPVIVTGASSQHYHKSLAMIKSVKVLAFDNMLPNMCRLVPVYEHVCLLVPVYEHVCLLVQVYEHV
jgi:hypothetical protein